MGKDRFYSHAKNKVSPASLGSANTFPYTRKEESRPGSPKGFSYLMGHIASNQRFDTILRGADHISVRKETETIRGSACYVIEADTKYGQYKVWLDPEHGYHSAKIQSKSEEGDYFKKHRLSMGDGGTAYLDIVSFEKVDGVWVPMEVNGGHHRFAGSPEYCFSKEDTHFKRTQIILNPDHDKLGSFADPILEDPNNDPELVNGTRVRIDRLPTRYIWQDGRAVPDNR